MGLFVVGFWPMVKILIVSEGTIKHFLISFVAFAIISIIYLPLETITKNNPYGL